MERSDLILKKCHYVACQTFDTDRHPLAASSTFPCGYEKKPWIYFKAVKTMIPPSIHLMTFAYIQRDAHDFMRFSFCFK